ncbi:haloalkane dehalogenase [Pedobacter frigidisoli]|uniref:Haloalkane dehalogenase n=1 Tax=Pedobacter frigidisoli TaxID=2530455 RepID=A0A4R0NFG9_9SPHI|nr:haloalkane dehalogenase [Pedobacter frigidisoli]TCC97962.1 haloalkane dehalogenase [Pedobacter frigidisoli]
MKDFQSPYKMKGIEILNSQMTYIDEGYGPTILFLHGNPTSSYLWRNIIPYMLPHYRCIAPDLIGFGESDKPQIRYKFEDHANYLEQFIKSLHLENLILVLHDWGSALGFDWARRHESQVRGLVFMEFMHPFPTWQDFGEQGAAIFKKFRDPEIGRKLLVEENFFIEGVLAGGVLKGLEKKDMDVYRQPFLSPADREPLYRFPNEVPIAGEPVNVYAMATAYHDWLLKTDISKLFLWVTPGALISVEKAAWYEKNLKNCKSVKLGNGSHYVQEDHPDKIGLEIASWVANLVE